jgi:hypothetical protein
MDEKTATQRREDKILEKRMKNVPIKYRKNAVNYIKRFSIPTVLMVMFKNVTQFDIL